MLRSSCLPLRLHLSRGLSALSKAPPGSAKALAPAQRWPAWGASRSFRATQPAEIGPFVAGIGVAVAIYGTRLLLQAASNPKFQEAMQDATSKPEDAPSSKRSATSPEAASPSSPSDYFTTDVMGVDLGQGPKDWSSACVAVVEDGEARVVESAQGQRHTPSLVVFQDGGELVGQPALRLLFSKTDTAVHGHQLLLGVPFDSAECEELARALPLELAADAAGEAAILVHGVAHAPADIAARLLAQLKGNAEDALGGRAVLSAVVGVPVNAPPAARAALERAGARAGLQRLELLAEPVAPLVDRAFWRLPGVGIGSQAASKTGGPASHRPPPSTTFHHLLLQVAAANAAAQELPELGAARTLGVYALGGRSFSFSVLRRAEAAAPTPGWEVVAAADEALLGSEALDEAVVSHLVEDFRSSDGIDLSSDNLAMHRLHEAAENAKAELCTAGAAKISLPYISADAAGPKHMELTLRRWLKMASALA